MDTGINDLEIACLVRVFSFLPAKDCGQAACVHRLWRDVLADDMLWKPHLATDFAAVTAVNPNGTAAASFRAAYASWQTAYADVCGPLLARSLAAWNSIKAWLAEHSPQILETLNPGATAEQLAEAEEQLGHPLPAAMRCIYRIHNGQDLKLDKPKNVSNDGSDESGSDDDEGPPKRLMMGLFGCLAFYEHITSNALQPLSQVVKYTLLLRTARSAREQSCHELPRNRLLLTVFSQMSESSGDIYLKLSPGRDWPLAPSEGVPGGQCDSLLRWMEEYGRRLSSGWYGDMEGDSMLAGSGVNVAGAINLFPRSFPAAATTITRGLQ
eukprot:gene4185-4433_t